MRLFKFLYQKFLLDNPDYYGINRWCNICGFRFSKFMPVEHNTLPTPPREASCPVCNYYERHRHLYIHISSIYPFLKGKNILHFAPEKSIKYVLSKSGANYIDADRSKGHATHQIDITEINYPDNFFDYIFCTHVLEHIPDDHKAMSELARVLNPNGLAYICVPFTTEFKEDLTITSPEERERLYGQSDHVRYYNQEVFIERLHKAGFGSLKISCGSDFPEYYNDCLLGNDIYVIAQPDRIAHESTCKKTL